MRKSTTRQWHQVQCTILLARQQMWARGSHARAKGEECQETESSRKKERRVVGEKSTSFIIHHSVRTKNAPHLNIARYCSRFSALLFFHRSRCPTSPLLSHSHSLSLSSSSSYFHGSRGESFIVICRDSKEKGEQCQG